MTGATGKVDPIEIVELIDVPAYGIAFVALLAGVAIGAGVLYVMLARIAADREAGNA